MPTYADEWNEKQRALGQSGPSNPVRLTISKGEYEWDPHSNRFCYVERWEEEHLMEDEELPDANHLAAVSSAVDGHGSRGSSPSLPAAIQDPVLNGRLEGMRTSLWVLDTNTLLSCLDLLKALFASLLTRNVTYAAASKQRHPHARRSSIRLILPYVVVSELDGLKISKSQSSSGRSVSSQARNANHWLLSALQKQKRVPIDEAGTNLSEDLWPLFVQPSSHYKAPKGSRGNSRWDLNDFTTADDEIVKFCVDLNQQTSSIIRFCSDDTNARTKAELDGIDTFAMREFANALEDNFKKVRPEDKWTYVADEIIDQWEYQLGSAEQQQQHHRQAVEPHAHMHHSPPQAAWQEPVPTSQSQSPAPHAAQTPPLQSPHRFESSAPSAEINEIDMETEEPSLPVNGKSHPAPSLSPRHTTRKHPAVTTEGRGTTDSIHSPQNARKPTRMRSTRRSPSGLRSPTASLQPERTANEQTAESEALNPTINWEDLVQQNGSSSRASKKQRNGRW